MKLSVFYHHVLCAAQQQGVSVEEMLRRVRDLGIEYVEMDLRDVQAVEPLARLLSGCGIKVSSVYGFYEWQKDPKAFQDWRQLECARFLGAGQVMVIPGLFSSNQETERNVQRQRMLEAMSVFCDRAAQEGLTVTIEDFDDAASPISTMEGMKWFTDRLPLLRVALDTGNFFYSGEDVLQALELFADRIVHVHCKDRLTGEQGPYPGERQDSALGVPLYPCAVGSGCIPMARCLQRLAQAGYDGIYAIEHFGANDYWHTIRESARWLLERGL